MLVLFYLKDPMTQNKVTKLQFQSSFLKDKYLSLMLHDIYWKFLWLSHYACQLFAIQRTTFGDSTSTATISQSKMQILSLNYGDSEFPLFRRQNWFFFGNSLLIPLENGMRFRFMFVVLKNSTKMLKFVHIYLLNSCR